MLAPARDEALSSWMARHAGFFGTSRTGLLRHPTNGERQRQGWTLYAVVPGFDAALERHGIEIPRTTRVSVPLPVPVPVPVPVRTALLAGFALATADPATAIRAM